MPTQVVSSDFCRGLVADDENDQSATPDAFDVLHHIVGSGCAAGLLTVVDATNVQRTPAPALVELAKRARRARRRDRARRARGGGGRAQRAPAATATFGGHVVAPAAPRPAALAATASQEGFRKVHVLRGVDEIERGDDRPREVAGTTSAS